MRGQQYKDLWEIRFLHILSLEEESSAFYTRLLKQNKLVLEDTRLKGFLEQIVDDRRKRARIARELVQLVRKKRLAEEPRNENY